MKKAIVLVVCLVVACFFSNCAKPAVDECKEVTCITPKMVWKAPHGKTTGNQRSTPIIYQDKVICAYGDNDEGDGFMAYNKLNGKILWDCKIETQSTLLYSLGVIDHKLIHSSFVKLSTIDVNTGKIIANSNFLNNISIVPRITIFNKAIYMPYFGDGYVGILKTNENFTQLDTLVTTKPKNDTSVWVSKPILWINPDKDTILLYHTGNYDGKTEFNAYNIKKKKLMWRKIVPASSNTLNPIIEDNKIIYVGNPYLISINLLDGEILWKNAFDGNLALNPMLKVGNDLYFLDISNKLQRINASTGAVLNKWDLNFYGGFSEMVYHNGIIYATSSDNNDGLLYAIDATTGKIIWEYSSPNRTIAPNVTFAHQDIVLDTQNGYLYVADDMSMYCFELVKK
jgi:outer membrane protein assembly factor BamB